MSCAPRNLANAPPVCGHGQLASCLDEHSEKPRYCFLLEYQQAPAGALTGGRSVSWPQSSPLTWGRRTS
eukprot:9470745-Pyramimonas_sp.AAC.1